MNKIRQFLIEVGEQLRQVIWPTKDDLVRLTAVVIFISIVVGVFLSGADFVFAKVIGWLTLAR